MGRVARTGGRAVRDVVAGGPCPRVLTCDIASVAMLPIGIAIDEQRLRAIEAGDPERFDGERAFVEAELLDWAELSPGHEDAELWRSRAKRGERIALGGIRVP